MMQSIIDGQIVELFWARQLSSLLIVLLFAAAIGLTFFLYRNGRGLPGRVRLTLALCRMLALCLMVAVLLEPMAAIHHTTSVKPRLAVLIDNSQSMSISDQRKTAGDLANAAVALGMMPVDDAFDVNRSMSLGEKQRQAIAAASRLDLAKGLIAGQARPVLESMEQDLDVTYYAFGDRLRKLGGNGQLSGPVLESLKGTVRKTAIADTLKAAVNVDRRTPLSGVVMFTDGLDNASGRLETAVQNLGARGIPVFTIPMGIESPDDVAIRNIVVQEVAFSGDKVPVRVQIQSRGYEKRTVALSLKLNGRHVAKRSVSLSGGLQFEDIFFNVDIHEKGAAQLQVALEPFTDEATPVNNNVKRSIRIVNEKIKVLCIEGSARWEYRYLRAMLKRDPRIDVKFIATRGQPGLAQSSSEYISSFPESREEAFEYDLVILGDVNADFFSTDSFLRLEELVKERGGSLLMLCGARYAPTSYAGTPLEKMLPVTFEGVSIRSTENGDGSNPASEAAWEDVDDSVYPVLTPEGRSSLVMTLETDREENDLVWSRVAPLDRLPPLLEPKPGATVLVELSDQGSRGRRFPLVSWQRYGAGKCMMMGTDRLWLLRFKTGDKYHWRVWSQCIQFLTLSRLMGEHKRIRLETDRSVYPLGGHARLYAHLLDDEYEPIAQSGFDVMVTALDGKKDGKGEQQRVTLRPDATTAGLFEGYFSPPAVGGYRVEASGSEKTDASTIEFQVTDPNPELTETDMQIERLRQIAGLTGGACLSAAEIGRLETLVNREPEMRVVRSEVPLWDNGVVAFALIMLLGFEWVMRRRYDLP